MEFSKRIGKVASVKQPQIEGIDDELKNALWNGINIYVIDHLQKRHDSYSQPKFRGFAKVTWHVFYKLTIDSIPEYDYQIEAYIKSRFFSDEWFKVYDFIEFILTLETSSFNIDLNSFKEFCNNILEKEFSGYRIIDNQIAPITNSAEISEIEMALDNTDALTSHKGANIHLHAALKKLSDKIAPDYRNSIKESISAIESLAKMISSNEKDSLAAALDKIKGKIKLHPALEKAFKQLYGYTSDSGGIRHSLTEDPNCDFEDAQFMLISSSAFVNYLIVKAKKSGITL